MGHLLLMSRERQHFKIGISLYPFFLSRQYTAGQTERFQARLTHQGNDLEERALTLLHPPPCPNCYDPYPIHPYQGGPLKDTDHRLFRIMGHWLLTQTHYITHAKVARRNVPP